MDRRFPGEAAPQQLPATAGATVSLYGTRRYALSQLAVRVDLGRTINGLQQLDRLLANWGSLASVFDY